MTESRTELCSGILLWSRHLQEGYRGELWRSLGQKWGNCRVAQKQKPSQAPNEGDRDATNAGKAVAAPASQTQLLPEISENRHRLLLPVTGPCSRREKGLEKYG